MFLALIFVHLGLLLIGVESKSTFVIRGFLHIQDIVECGLPFMTLFQVFLQRSELGLELLISSTWLVATKALEEV